MSLPFGRADQLDHDALKRLVYSIARVTDLVVHEPVSEGAFAEPGEGSRASDVLPAGVEQVRTRKLRCCHRRC